MVGREGVETVLLLTAVSLTSAGLSSAVGAALGLVAAAGSRPNSVADGKLHRYAFDVQGTAVRLILVPARPVTCGRRSTGATSVVPTAMPGRPPQRLQDLRFGD